MRNFFYRLQNGMAKFMYGRNGTDQLNLALLVVYLVLCVVQIFFSRNAAVTAVFNILTLLLAVLVLFRLFSRNLTTRRAENAKFLNWWYPVKSRVAGAKARRQDKEHKYFTCKNCKTICRVPTGKGKIEITCPKCGQKIIGKS